MQNVSWRSPIARLRGGEGKQGFGNSYKEVLRVARFGVRYVELEVL